MKRWHTPFVVLVVCLLTLGPIGYLEIQHFGKAAHAQNPVTFTEFPLPQNSHIESITAGPDGNVWFTLSILQAGPTYGTPPDIGRITPSGIISFFPLPSINYDPGSIAIGPDGNLWFTEEVPSPDGQSGIDAIGRITPSGVFSEFALGSGHRVDDITAGPDGNLWFIDDIASAIGRITTAGVMTEFLVPSIGVGGFQNKITTGPDGNLWFTDLNVQSIGRITPQGIVTEFPVSLTGNSLSDPGGITGGSDGNIWFTFDQAIGRITPTGTVTMFPVPNAGIDNLGYWTEGMTAGPDGNVWFTEPSAFKIGSITPSGSITEYPLPTGSNYYPSTTIVTGPDGNLWFTEDNKDINIISSAIGRMDLPTSQAQAYVALGDSYSSGEGAPNPNYLLGTDDHTIPNLCHRSTAAYPWLTHSATKNTYTTFVFRACSGAIIKDFTSANQEGNKGEQAQLSWLNSYTGLVTLTIGGNDIGFHDVMSYCAVRLPFNHRTTCEAKFGQQVDAAIARISAAGSLTNPYTLPYLYKTIKSDAPNAEVLVLGYPRLFPINPPKICATGVPGSTFRQSDMIWLNNEGSKLDNVIQKAAVQAGFTYVDTYNAFNGHELCTKDPYVNRAVIDTSYDPSKLTQWSFHPNIKGQAALAAIVECIHSCY